MNFVPCVTWVKKGVSKEFPKIMKLSKSELKSLIEESITDLKDLKVDNEEDVSPEKDDEKSEEPMDGETDDDEDVISKYNLESYDDDDDNKEGASKASIRQIFGPAEELSDEENLQNEKNVDSDDEENIKIQPDDNLIIVGHVTEDCSILEVYVFNEKDDDLYVHHDIILPAFPVCLEWLRFGPEGENSSNYLAIGDMTPIINIWDLDAVDTLEPVGKLGKKLKKKERKKLASSGEQGHIDAVLDLSWNSHLGHALASGSADHSAILWDLSTFQPVTHLRHHTDKVSCIEWHPFEAEILLTGSSDKCLKLYDARALEEKNSWTINGEVEKVLWNHFQPFNFLAGSDQGDIYCFDVRQKEPLFMVDAHSKGISDMALSSSCQGLLVSTGSFTSLRIWDIRNNQPVLVESKKLKEGNLLSCRSSPDSPFVFAVGGDKPSSNFKVLNLLKSDTVRNRFAPQSTETKPLVNEAPEGQPNVNEPELGCNNEEASGGVSAGSSSTTPTGTKRMKRKILSKKFK